MEELILIDTHTDAAASFRHGCTGHRVPQLIACASGRRFLMTLCPARFGVAPATEGYDMLANVQISIGAGEHCYSV